MQLVYCAFFSIAQISEKVKVKSPKPNGFNYISLAEGGGYIHIFYSRLLSLTGQKIQYQHGSAERRKHPARNHPDSAAFHAVGELRGDQRRYRSDGNADKQNVPTLQNDSGVYHDVTNRSDERGKSHDKRARADSGLQLHAEKRGKHDQHHHAAARSDKARAEADSQPEKQRDHHAPSAERLTLFGGVFPRGVGLYKKAYADKERQKKRKAAQHHIPRQPRHIAPDRTHRENTNEHYPTAF